MTAAVAAAGVVAAIVWVAGLDQIATQIYSRLTPPAVTAVPVERDVVTLPDRESPPPADREPTAMRPEPVTPVPSAPAASMPPVPVAAEDKPTVERRAPAAVRPSPAGLSTIDGRPRAVIEERAPAAPRAPVVSRAPVEPRPSVESRPSIAPRAVIESSAPNERRAPTERPPQPERNEAGSSDGSAAVDWLLRR